MKLLFLHVRRRLPRLAAGISMLLLTNLTSMAIPQLIRYAVDLFSAAATGGGLTPEVVAGLCAKLPAPLRLGLHGLHGLPLHELLRVALALCVVALLGMVFRTASRVHLLFAARDVEVDIRCSMYRHLTCLDPEFYARHTTGDLLSRATNDLTQVRLMLGPGILNLFNTVVAYGMALPLMLWMSPKLTCIAFATYPPALYLMRRLGRQLYGANKRQQQALGKLTGRAQENLRGAFLVRAFAAESSQQQAFDEVNVAYLRDSVALSWTRSGMFRLSMSLASLGTVATVLWGGMDVMDGRLSLGDVVAIVEYMALLSWPTFALGWVLSLWQRGAASLARIQEILDAPAAEALPASEAAAAPGAATLRLANLTVTYEGRAALQDVTFSLPEGTTLGIVGAIGSGKSTLIMALLRLVPSAPQQIFVGERPIEALSRAALRRMFGLVPQNPTLFSDSIAANVAFGRPQASRQQIDEVVRQAALEEDVAVLPQGLDTQIGERGVSLSGGQKQRCAIARALLLDPPILVLDDALSAVDVATEHRILTNLRRMRRGRTTVIVAHRLSAVAHAEQVIVLHRGAIVQQGSPAELLATEGFYATLARQQQSAAVAEP